MIIRYFLSILVVVCSTINLIAQPELIFKRIEVRYPEVKLYFRVNCNGSYRADMQPQNFEIRENGILVKNATLWCPPNDGCCISASLVFDRSGSMIGEKIAQVKKGGNAFVDQMNQDGIPCDEAAVISFREYVMVDVPMTTDKAKLKNAIDAMEANGRTAVWDATAVGVQMLKQLAKNRCKAVILLSDGGDNSSRSYNVATLIQYALLNGAKIFTIGYGIDAGSIEASELESIATATSGKFYLTKDGTDITKIYTEIKEIIKDEYRECYLSYNIDCPDGTRRVVDLTIKNFCGGTDTKSKSYLAPLDRSKFKIISLELGSATVLGGQEAIIPLILKTPIDAMFSSAEFTLTFNRNVCELLGVSTAGTLLDSIPVTYQDVGSGYKFFILKSKYISGSGVLLYLRFAGLDLDVLNSTPLWLSNWYFDGYCLIPNLLPGLFTVEPRKPKLDCDVSIPNAIVWNDSKKQYEPNPFTVSAVIRNSGTREARDVKASITISSPSLVLSSPTKANQNVSPSIINPGEDGKVQWQLISLKSDKRDSAIICFTFTSSNHPSISCCKNLVISAMQSSAITCTITAPDTIYFREQYYEPDAFDIHLTAINTGTGQTKDVYGQLLQDTRFTIIPPAHQLLSPLLLAKDTARAKFRVQVHPRQTDGYDTVRVQVQGDDTDPAWCYYPIWVQRERSPKFSLICTAQPDSLIFNEKINEYEPNPFVVTTLATNIGETYAEDCQIMFVGPPRFTPIGTNLRPAGTMQVNDTREEQWLIRALPRTVGEWDTLVFQVSGKGGLGKKIVVAECRLPVYVPAIRTPKYTVQCFAPDSVLFVQSKYEPDPFELKLQITNTGTASGWNLRPTIILSQSITLIQGENATKNISEIKIGETKTVSWFLSPSSRNYNEIVRLCARVIDNSGANEECCRDVFISKIEEPSLGLSCMSIDTLHIDSQSGEYRGNPFNAFLTIRNNGKGIALNVKASINLLGTSVRLEGKTDTLIGDLLPGASITLKWFITAMKRTASAAVPVEFHVTADNSNATQCNLSVFIPAIQHPALHALCSSTPQDSLLFDWNIGDFNPSEFTVDVNVKNYGSITARTVYATLILPSGVSLSSGETIVKNISPINLEPNASGVASWKLKAIRQKENAEREFTFIIRADNADEASCIDKIIIQGAPYVVTLSIPKNNLFAFGQRGNIPVNIDRTIGKDITRYSFELVYDPTVISLYAVSNAGTLTNFWVSTKMVKVSDGRMLISDYTTGFPLRSEAGVLLNLLVEGVYQNDKEIVSFGESALRIDSSTAVINKGDVDVRTIDGDIIVTNKCLNPLEAGAGYKLEQNRPNPFNPETIISYSIPSNDYVRLTVIDKMGRDVAVLADEYVVAGPHSVKFDGKDFPSGMYFYRLQTSKFVDVKKMILAK